ncbi:MAG: RNA polymerase sigma factor [Phycisphaerae bacterium]|nr:RNA polymerase sigma factor [Phycisphaerae bacterium]
MNDVPNETIRRCQAGHAAAFAEVVEWYERPVFAYVVRMGCRPGGRGPEDVVQEIFVKVYQNIQRYQDRAAGSFSAWLFTIARNHCISLIRKTRTDGHSMTLEEAGELGVADDAVQDPVDCLARSEIAGHVAEAVQLLPEPMRTAFILRYYQDMGFTEIARILGCKEGTARTRVTRAKQALARLLQDVFNDR